MPKGKIITQSKKFFFVDESGDSIFFDKYGKNIIGEEGCSPILILGFIVTSNPGELRQEMRLLKEELKNDEYVKEIPSLKKTLISFHAKDDCPEIREKVFKLLKRLNFKAQFIVARKKIEIFTRRHKRDEDIFYHEIVSRLFERSLHINNNIIYFSKRGTRSKQAHLTAAVQNAILNFEAKYNVKIETQTKVFIQVPTDEICLQIIDYMNWIIYRAYTKKEMRYLNFLKEKISFICDIYDFEKYPNNFYSKKNPFEIDKISPLELGGEPRTA